MNKAIQVIKAELKKAETFLEKSKSTESIPNSIITKKKHNIALMKYLIKEIKKAENEHIIPEVIGVRACFNEYTGILVTEDLIITVLDNNKHLKTEVEDGTWTDTCIREELMNKLAMKTVKMEIPLNGSSPEYKNRFKQRCEQLIKG